jgi:hypothetical protein
MKTGVKKQVMGNLNQEGLTQVVQKLQNIIFCLKIIL